MVPEEEDKLFGTIAEEKKRRRLLTTMEQMCIGSHIIIDAERDVFGGTFLRIYDFDHRNSGAEPRAPSLNFGK